MAATADKIYEAKVFLWVADPDATLASGYDTIRVDRSTGPTVPFQEFTRPGVSRLTIESGKRNYHVLDPEAEVDFRYKPVLMDSNGVQPDSEQTVQKAVDTSYERVVTVNELKTFYLFGLDLSNDQGVDYPDALYVEFIRSAIAWAEQKLDLHLTPKYIERESHDFYRRDYEKYAFIRAKKFPVLQVDRLALEYPQESTILEFPAEWIQLDADSGTIQVVPARGVFNQLLISQGGGFLPVVFGGAQYLPGVLKLTYHAGFALGELPDNLKEVVAMKACFGPLNIAGDLLGGAGIASQSLGVDSLHSSFNTTSSATNAGYGARLVQYTKQLKTDLPVLRKYYKGIALVSV